VSALGAMRYRPLASPAFVERWAPGGWDARAATEAPMLVFDRKDALQDRYLDRFAPGARPPRQYVPASTEFVGAAMLGLGWGMIPDLQAQAMLADGRLVVLDEGGAVDVSLYWQQWSLQSAALSAVAAAIAQAAAVALRPA
jgi:LysR family transcriptional regulator (chromosome initiation inhibitor)